MKNGQSCLIFVENKIKSGGPWCKFLDVTKMYEIQAAIGAIILKTFTINSPYLLQYDHRIQKVDLTDNLGSPWNISQNKVAPYTACVEK